MRLSSLRRPYTRATGAGLSFSFFDFLVVLSVLWVIIMAKGEILILAFLRISDGFEPKQLNIYNYLFTHSSNLIRDDEKQPYNKNHLLVIF